MKKEKSCGVIPYIIKNNEIQYLLVKQNNGFTCFPKGHVEINETEEETALRETYEETGLKAEIVEGFKETISYYMPEYDASKDVVLFIGKINDLNYKAQEKEISNIIVAPYEEALKLLEFENWQKVLIKAHKYLIDKVL